MSIIKTAKLKCDMCGVEGPEHDVSMKRGMAMLRTIETSRGWIARSHEQFCPECKILRRERHSQHLQDENMWREYVKNRGEFLEWKEQKKKK